MRTKVVILEFGNVLGRIGKLFAGTFRGKKTNQIFFFPPFAFAFRLSDPPALFFRMGFP